MLVNTNGRCGVLAASVLPILLSMSCSQRPSANAKNESSISDNSSVLANQKSEDVQDITVVSEITLEGQLVATTSEYYSGNKARVSVTSVKHERRDNIVDFSLGHVISIDHSKKEFYENSIADTTSAIEKNMIEQRRQLSKILKDHPEVELASRDDNSRVIVNKYGKSKTIAGYSCNQYAFSKGSLKVDVWATTELPKAKQYYANLKFMSQDPLFEKLIVEVLDEMEKQVKGFPLAIKQSMTFSNDTVETLTEVKEVRLGHIAEAVFSPPDGYKPKKGISKHFFDFKAAIQN